MMRSLVIIIFFISVSSLSFGQNDNGILKSKFFADTLHRIAIDTFLITIINQHTNEIVSETKENKKIKISLPPGLYNVVCVNRNGASINVENVKISIRSITFYDIDVSKIVEKR